MTRSIWLVGTNNITAANVDTNYQLFISNETSGTFEHGRGHHAHTRIGQFHDVGGGQMVPTTQAGV
jgi:hypothetical protein